MGLTADDLQLIEEASNSLLALRAGNVTEWLTGHLSKYTPFLAV
jgi:hypothetical protein